MRRTRIYCENFNANQETLSIDNAAHHHIANVLRMRADDEVFIFDGRGLEIRAKIIATNKKQTTLALIEVLNKQTESPCQLSLAQCITAKKEKMDWIIQKACELGVYQITPIISEYCQSPQKTELQKKRIQHWQKIIINACEQCGRNVLPTLNAFTSFEAYLKQQHESPLFLLNPHNNTETHLPEKLQQAHLIIGPEGGFSTHEVSLAAQHTIHNIQLGPRILRAETAAISALTLFQARYGDLST